MDQPVTLTPLSELFHYLIQPFSLLRDIPSPSSPPPASKTGTSYPGTGCNPLTRSKMAANSSLGTAAFAGTIAGQHRADQEKICSQLGRRRTDEDFVFAHLDGRPINPNAVMLAFIRLIRRSGLPHIRLHDLRHTHATLMLKAGVHPKVVSERLGHAGIGITLDIYSHVLPGLQEAAAERFDEMLGSKSMVEEETSVSKPLVKHEGLNGSAYRIRTGDLLLEREVS